MIQGRSICKGKAEGEALATSTSISFFGGIDPETGTIVERGHELEGQCIAGKILVFPTGKGSTVGSYTLYRLKKAGFSPLAIVNAECEPITAVGCIISDIPCVDKIPIDQIHTGMRLMIDGDKGTVKFKPDNERGGKHVRNECDPAL
jgi:predicted aconitase with swiveling domain